MWHCPLSGLSKSFKKWLLTWLTQRSMILRGDWLSAVWYCGETDLVQYDTAGRFLRTIQTTQRNLNQNRKYFNPVSQWPRLVRMMKKTGGRKSRWTVPLINSNLNANFKAFEILCFFFLNCKFFNGFCNGSFPAYFMQFWAFLFSCIVLVISFTNSNCICIFFTCFFIFWFLLLYREIITSQQIVEKKLC